MEDEITRWVNWAKIAPPFGGGMQPGGPPSSASSATSSSPSSVPDMIRTSKTILFDAWTFRETDNAAVIGHHLENVTVKQGAPAIISRGNIPLPSVEPTEGFGREGGDPLLWWRRGSPTAEPQ